MKKLILILAVGMLAVTSAFSATLQSNSIFATSKENLEMAVHLATHQDYAGLEEMDREGKINVFKTRLEVNVVASGFGWISFTFPGKTDILYTATEFVK